MKRKQGGVLAVDGFRAAGASAGLKTRMGALDVAVLFSDRPSTVAGCFTTNRIRSAAVEWSHAVARRGRARAVLVNSGNANACTGARGERDVAASAKWVAGHLGIGPSEVLVASTGIIGHPLPMKKLHAGVNAACRALGTSSEHDAAVARAIMTTDTVPKSASVSFRLGGRTVHVGGVAKGAGMISPRLATMLSFLTTDASVSAPLLRRTLRAVVDRTYNRLTVDGDCSTNDTVLLLANGASNVPKIKAPGKDLHVFSEALETVAQSLVEQLARDGEGATRLIVVTVRRARCERDADRVARAVATSPLVKCAVNGGDPNWGRIVCAAGYSGAPVEPSRLRLKIGNVLVFRRGMPVKANAAALRKAMSGNDVLLDLDLGQGDADATMWTCDFSKDYVAINADYQT